MRTLLVLLLVNAATSSVVVNEIATSGDSSNSVCAEDFIELFNSGSTAATITGLVVSDDHGHGYSSQLVLGAGTCQSTMPAGSFLLLCRNGAATLYSAAGTVLSSEGGCGHTFGMGSSDVANLYASTTDSTLLSSSVSSASPSTDSSSSWARASVDGTGSFLKTGVRTPGAKNAFLVINEMATTGSSTDMCAGEDWLELYNPTVAAVSLTGLQLTDDHGLPYSKSLTLGQGACPTSLPPGAFMVLCKGGTATVGTSGSGASTAGCGFEFGMGGDDTAQLYDANGLLIDSSGAAPDAQSATITYGRYANAFGTFGLMTSSPLAVNANAPAGAVSPPPPPTWLVQGHPDFRPIVISEVADKEDDTDLCAGVDWVELHNPTASAESLTGLVLVDDKGHGHSDQLVLGGTGCPSTLAAGAYLLLCKEGKAWIGSTSYDSCGFNFGIGGGDTLTLFLNSTHDHYLDRTPGCCANSNTHSFGLASVDGTGNHTVLPVRTPGVQNIWSVVINEVATTGSSTDLCAGEDWVELYNPTAAAVSLTGLQLTDDHGLPYSKSLTLGQGTCPVSLPAGAFLVFCKGGAATLFDNGVSTPYSTGCSFTFGMGGSDTIQLYMPDGTTLLDTTGHLGDLGSVVQSQGRPTIGQAYGVMQRTPGAANIASAVFASPPPAPEAPPASFPPLVASAVKVNEVAATGNTADLCAGEDWIELWNPTAASASLIGMVLVDDKGHGHTDRLIMGGTGCPQSLGADQYLVVCKRGAATVFANGATVQVYPASNNCGMEFGVGDGDTINLYLSQDDSSSLADTTPNCCSNSMDKSFGRTTHDGTGPFHITSRTPGMKNYNEPPMTPPPSFPPPPASPPLPPPPTPSSPPYVPAPAECDGNCGQVSFTIDATIEAFDSTAFLTSLATFASTPVSNLYIKSISAGSIEVVVGVLPAAAAAVDVALTDKTKEELSSALAVIVTATPTASLGNTLVVTTESSGLGTGAIIGIAVGSASGVIGLASIAVYMMKAKAPTVKLGAPTPVEMQMGAKTTTSTSADSKV